MADLTQENEVAFNDNKIFISTYRKLHLNDRPATKKSIKVKEAREYKKLF
jgi:hypothetical protein